MDSTSDRFSLKFFCGNIHQADIRGILQIAIVILLALCSSATANGGFDLFDAEHVMGLQLAGELLRSGPLSSEKRLELVHFPSDSEWDIEISELKPDNGAVVSSPGPEAIGFFVQGKHKVPDALPACAIYGILACRSLDTNEIWLRQYHGLVTAVGDRGMSVKGWHLPAGNYTVSVLLLLQERPNGKIVLAAMRTHKFLVAASLSDDEFDRQVAELRSDQRKATTRRILWELLGSSSLSKRNWKTIAEFEELAELDLSGLRLSADATQAIRSLTRLSELRIDDCVCTEEVWKAIGQHPQLREVSAKRSMSRRGWLTHLRSESKICRLDLSHHTLDSEDVVAISKMLQLSSLNLSHATLLQKIPRDTVDSALGLRELDISYSSLQDSDLRAILRNPGLKGINLSHTVVADNTISDIAALPSLEWIDLSSTGVSENAIERVGLAPNLTRITLDAKFMSSPIASKLNSKRIEVRWVQPKQDVWAELWRQLN